MTNKWNKFFGYRKLNQYSNITFRWNDIFSKKYDISKYILELFPFIETCVSSSLG
jgi:hypothetical protein